MNFKEFFDYSNSVRDQLSRVEYMAPPKDEWFPPNDKPERAEITPTFDDRGNLVVLADPPDLHDTKYDRRLKWTNFICFDARKPTCL